MLRLLLLVLKGMIQVASWSLGQPTHFIKNDKLSISSSSSNRPGNGLLIDSATRTEDSMNLN